MTGWVHAERVLFVTAFRARLGMFQLDYSTVTTVLAAASSHCAILGA